MTLNNVETIQNIHRYRVQLKEADHFLWLLLTSNHKLYLYIGDISVNVDDIRVNCKLGVDSDVHYVL